MFVVQVNPLIRGTQLESLSYFSSEEFPIGSFVEVPIRGKAQKAIVTDTRPVSSTKTALKAATFSLRKLPKQPQAPVLPQSIRQTASELSLIYPASVGAITFQLLPPDIRNGSRPYPPSDNTKNQSEETTPQLLTARLDERFDIYQSFIRTTFAHKGSIMVVVPTAVDVEYAQTELKHGIEDRLVVFSPTQTKKQREEAYGNLADTTTAKLIITTPSHAYLNRSDLMAIVVEQSASSHYVTRQRPYLDHRQTLIKYAKLAGRSILLGDTVPRTEDEVKRREEIYLTYGEEVKRMAFAAPLNIINQKDTPKPDQPFKLFSTELVTSVQRTLESGGNVFFYAARRGLAPLVSCIDCGYIFRCPDSDTPYSLLRTTKDGEEKRWFVSSTSGKKIPAADVCEQCGSWRLRERGIGIQAVFDEWKKIMPDTQVILMDTETAKTPQQAKKIANEFYKQKSVILLGTQIALPFLSKGVDLSAVISLDAARSIPTWRADESLFRLLLRLRECTAREVIIQTRTETDDLMMYAARGAIERFYDDEISLREMMSYPPYSTFILLTWLGSTAVAKEIEAKLVELLPQIDINFYNSPNGSNDKTERNALIRLGGSESELTQVLQIIKKLPPFIKIQINPDRIV